MPRALILQLARLGDLIQSLPAITSLHSSFPKLSLDLLCAAPLVPLGRILPGIQGVYPWEGEEWHRLAIRANLEREHFIGAAEQYFDQFSFPEYSVAYNLNNHPRSILAAHLLSTRVVGAGDQGPLSTSLSPWVAYLRQIAQERGTNRIHLADAFCGICGIRPPTDLPTINIKEIKLPGDIEQVVQLGSGMQIGLVLGAGDFERRTPLVVWKNFLEFCTEHVPHSRIFLIGGGGERETSLVLEHSLSDRSRNQVINCCGRTSLPQLAALLHHCQWVVGSDTGPLHLGVLCGAQAIGWYFSRARVHETGPYGEGHWVWQAEEHQRSFIVNQQSDIGIVPERWPIKETVDLLLENDKGAFLEGWSLWRSHRDRLGAYYCENDASPGSYGVREQVWELLGRETIRCETSPLESSEVSVI